MRLVLLVWALATFGCASKAKDVGRDADVDVDVDIDIYASALADLSVSTADLTNDAAMNPDDLTTSLPPDLASTSTPDMPSAPMATIHFIGRFDVTDPAKPKFAFPGSMITTRFSGTMLDVTLADSAANNRFDISVDGVAKPLLQVMAGQHVYSIASGLPNANHDVVITKRTETNVGVTTFIGFSGATLVATPGPTRLVEIIGDSISCGYGILCTDPTVGFSAATEAETLAYAALTGKAVGFAHITVAYSGKGITQNYGGGTDSLAPDVWQRTLADDTSSQWNFSYTPDVVVVSLGTNDFWNGDPGSTFVTKYKAFLATIRGKYAHAYIIIALSPMLEDHAPDNDRSTCRTYLQTIVNDLANADPRLSFIEFAQQLGSDGLGCDYHPSQTTHQKMEVILEAKIRALTGW